MKEHKRDLSRGENKSLNVQPLKPSHLSMLALSKQTKRLGWMQIMLIRTLVAQAEENLQGLIPTRQPRCLVALEAGQLIALIVLQPNNRRGTSWSISIPEFLKDPINNSKQDILEALLQKALNIEHKVAQSWLIKCPNNDSQQLAISRELGFQPLKIIKKWSANSSSFEVNIPDRLTTFNEFSLQYLSKVNAPLLLRLQKVSYSAYLRELIDRQWIDLLDRNEPENQILISSENGKVTALFGLITPIGSEDLLSLELIRDLSWDSRLNKLVPILVKDLIIAQPQISLETSAEDKELNKILANLGLHEEDEKVLLGKSLLKRKTNTKLIKGESSFEKIFESLQPNQPPLPSPINLIY